MRDRRFGAQTRLEIQPFLIVQVPKSEGLKGLPVALEDKKEEGQSREEREEALERAVEERMEFLSALAGLAPVDHSCH